MAFSEQSVGNFLNAKRVASQHLIQETPRIEVLSLTEALILLAAGDLLGLPGKGSSFREQDVWTLTGLGHTEASGPLNGFVDIQVFTRETSGREVPALRRSLYAYTPTELGQKTVAFFQDPELKARRLR